MAIIKPVLIQDTRERKPIDFSNDTAFSNIIVRKLDFGDYSLEGLENEICIERKADGGELLTNLLQNKERIVAEFERMSACKHKFVVIEQDLADLLNPKRYYGSKYFKNKMAAPAMVMSYLSSLMLEQNVHVIFAGDYSKSIIRKILIAKYDSYKKQLPKDKSS